MDTGEKEKAPHHLSILAAEVVRRMADRPGTWDFEQAFNPHIELIKLEERAKENELAQSAIAAQEGKQLFLFKRGLEIQACIRAVKDQIAGLKP